MNGLLVRVCIDSSSGFWNAPVDPQTGEFVYVPIPEDPDAFFRKGLGLSYEKNKGMNAALKKLDAELPVHLKTTPMHLDPDFSELTYGDQGQRGKRILKYWERGEGLFLAFYAGLKSIYKSENPLVYAIVGYYEVEEIVRAADVAEPDWHRNAHTRIEPGSSDIVVFAKRGVSGRLKRCIPIKTEFRNHAYRVSSATLKEWGGLDVKDGFIQRSAFLPSFNSPERFREWLSNRGVALVQRNN